MIIVDVRELAIPDLKVIRYKKFSDDRGYFSEIFRATDIQNSEKTDFLKNENFNQFNEAYSKANTFRGLHFQWNPYMGKLVRCISGTLIDFALDIRINSPYFGKIISYELENTDDYGEWIWLPPGFAHGVYLPENTMIEYFCTGQWSKDCEVAINPYDKEIDWSLNSSESNELIKSALNADNLLITDKDKNGLSLQQWSESKDSSHFKFGEINNE